MYRTISNLSYCLLIVNPLIKKFEMEVRGLEIDRIKSSDIDSNNSGFLDSVFNNQGYQLLNLKTSNFRVQLGYHVRNQSTSDQTITFFSCVRNKLGYIF